MFWWWSSDKLLSIFSAQHPNFQLVMVVVSLSTMKQHIASFATTQITNCHFHVLQGVPKVLNIDQNLKNHLYKEKRFLQEESEKKADNLCYFC